MTKSTPEIETPPAEPADPELLEAGRLLFAQECRFIMSVARLEDLPPDDLPEVAFAGRSNVGKSSLVNALTGRRTLARTSNTPGRTQQLNFFDLGGRLTLVDLPGYGYAKASRSEVDKWVELIRLYLRGRVGLRRLCLLIDARHGIKPSDREMMDLLEDAAVVYQIVLTKADKVKATGLEACRKSVAEEIRRRAAANPAVIATSARKGDGIADMRAVLATLAAPKPLS